MPYGVLRAPRTSTAGGKRRSSRSTSSSGTPAQRSTHVHAAHQAYAVQSRSKPPPRQGGGPRARFPSNFPHRLADGSTDNAQVLTLDHGEPLDLEERLAGPSLSASLPHAEVSEPAYHLSSAYDQGARPRSHASHASKRLPQSSRGRAPSPSKAGGGMAAARRAGMPSAFASAFDSPSGSPLRNTAGAADFRSAMAELDSLRSAAVDPRDEARYARPQTAAGALGGVRSASADVTPGTAAAAAPSNEGGDEESAEDLRLRLSAAEAVMRKLYRRNNQLEEEVRQKVQVPARPQTAAARSGSVAAEGDSASAADVVDPLAGADEQALFLLQQKEADLQQMRDYTAQLQERLQSVAALQMENGNEASGSGVSERVETANAEYRDRYLRMRNDYRSLLKSRVGSIKKATPISRQSEQAVLLSQLDAALQEEADLHRRESQRLNEELYRQEKRSCDWHVERRILETRLAEMEGSIKQRDEIDGAIEKKMAALFTRLQQLESANLQLEQTNEELMSKVGASAGGNATPDGAACAHVASPSHPCASPEQQACGSEVVVETAGSSEPNMEASSLPSFGTEASGERA